MRKFLRRFVLGILCLGLLLFVAFLLIPPPRIKPPPPLPFDASAYVSTTVMTFTRPPLSSLKQRLGYEWFNWFQQRSRKHPNPDRITFAAFPVTNNVVRVLLNGCMEASDTRYLMPPGVAVATVQFGSSNFWTGSRWISTVEGALQTNTVQRLDSATGQMVPDTLVLLRFP